MWRLLCFFLLLCVRVDAQDLLYQSLKEGVGIRPASMGHAFTSLGEGVDSLFYNPSGLGRRGSSYKYENLDLGHVNFGESSHHSVYLSPFGYSKYRNLDVQENSVEVVSYGYGRQGINGIDWGINYKTVNQVYASGESNTGWSSDLGFLVHFTPTLLGGFTLKDIIKENLDIPTTFRAGLSLSTPKKLFTFSTDVVLNRWGGQTQLLTHGGLEYNISEGLILRSGLYKRMVSAGVGITLPFVNIEYGVQSKLEGAQDPVYWLGFNFGRGPARKDQRYSLFKQDAFAEFSIGTNLVEGKSEVSLLGGAKLGVNDLLPMIHQAIKDKSCQGFVVRVGHLSNSLTTVGLIQEVRKELANAKQVGKKIIVYLENWVSLPEYYLATIADDIVMPELGVISHLGLNLEVRKTTRFLNNFGIGTQILASGKYKASLSPESDGLTDSARLLVKDLMENLYHQVLVDIKDARDLDWANVQTLFDGRLISAQSAKEVGLVDHLGYWESAKELVASLQQVKKSRLIRLSEYKRQDIEATIFSQFNRIAVIEIDGMIGTGKSPKPFLFSGKGTGSDDIQAIVNKVLSDFTIRGVILRVNSPGGSLLASDQIYESIAKLRERGKLVYTSMGNIATSGGYYVAMNSNKIIANPGTLTGSIGVISVFQNYENMNKILGIDYETISTGKYMGMLSKNKELNDEEKAMFTSIQSDQYQGFVNKIKKNRLLSDKEAKEVAQGQLFTGKQALDLKLVDKLGGFYDAVHDLAEEAKIQGAPELVFYRSSTYGLSLFDLPFIQSLKAYF